MAAPGHSNAFLALVNDAKTRLKQIQAAELPAVLEKNPAVQVIDVREESEYAAGHVTGARWLGKGIIERDIQGIYPDRATPLYLYCGGGFRSALAADNLQKMGYTNVWNVDGGWRALKDLMPTDTEPSA
jgi:rhodanese-related sulfurtransferase